MLIYKPMFTGTALKCYTCVHNGKSPDNNNCLTLKDLEPTVCSQDVIKQRSMNREMMDDIRDTFRLDMVDNIQSTDWACLKVDYHGLNGMKFKNFFLPLNILEIK